jgi:hypothetical protein
MDNLPALIDGLEVLEKRLLSKDRVFTVGDAAAITGYRTDQAKQILDRLIAKYDCKLKITADGDLIYDFGTYPHRRGERTWAEWSRGVQKWWWKLFMLLFKIWIAVTLVVYFVIFLLILIAIIIAATASNKDGDSDSSSSFDLGGMFRILWEIFESAFRWNTHYSSTHYTIDMYGYPYQEYDSRRSPTHKNKKSFVASVYDYVFGPERVEISPLANKQEAGAYIRSQKGLIIVPEVIALAGWKGGEAENFLSELVVTYQGEAKISNESLLYGDFTEFARQKTSKQEAPVVWYWDEYEPEYKLTGNSFWRNFWITFMCLFNLTFSFMFIGAQLSPETSPLNLNPSDAWMFIVLGWIPFAFCVLFFGIPLMRWLNLGFLRRKRRMANIRKRVMRAIYQSDKEIISLKELRNVINQANIEKLSEDDVTRAMNEMIVDFYGDIDFDKDGQVIYKFTRLREEQREIRQLRGEQNTDMGKIVFQSE